MPPRILRTHDEREVTYRAMACCDGPALQQFNAGLSESSRDLFLPHAYDDATVTRMLNRSEAGTDYVIVAFHGDALVGYAFLWDIADPVPVLGIGLADAFQGQGIGKPLLTHLIDAATKAGAAGIELTTVPENKRAFALYQQLGFQHRGDTDNVAGDGRIVREHVMFLPLQPGATPPARNFAPPV